MTTKNKSNNDTPDELNEQVAMLPVGSESALGEAQDFVPSSREHIKLMSELQSMRQAIEDGVGDTTKPSDLADAGTVFDIVDAYFTTLREADDVDRQKIVFHLVEQDTGLFHKVMQTDDSRGIRRRYAEYFQTFRAMNVKAEPFIGYKFVYSDKVISGNRAIILTRVIERSESASL